MTVADHLCTLTDRDRDLLERTIEQFEAAWERGEHPSLDAHLPAASDLRNALTVELALSDLEYRLRAGESVTATEYLERYPEVRAAGAATELIAAEERWRHSSPTLSSATQFIIPGYDLLDELGRGGMGVVHRARQIAADRIVALKMIRTDAASDPELAARFRTEVEAAARLQHPHIVQIFEVGEHAGRPFFAMEFVTGGSLAERLVDGPLPPAEAAKLMLPLVGAIAAAHARGVIHRDLKPANILLQVVGDQWSVVSGEGSLGNSPTTDHSPPTTSPKVTDFGLAKRLDRQSDQTRTGAVIGTPSYMAPEQADGPAGDLTAAVDVYALGATLYACLTGRPPFQAATVWETIEQVRTCDPVPPRALQPGVPRDLETICLKCLRKDPGRRYASAADLAADLDRFLGGQPILARPVGPWERSWKWIKRRPAAATALAVSVLALFAVTGISVGFSIRLKTERDIADAHRDRAETSYRLAREAMESGLVKLRDDPRFNRGEMQDVRRAMLQAEARFYEQFVQIQGDDPAFQFQRAEAFFGLGKATASLGSKQEAVGHFRAAIGIIDQLIAAEPASTLLREQRGRYLEQLGLGLRATGKLTESQNVMAEAESICEELLRKDPNNRAKLHRLIEFLMNRNRSQRLAWDFDALRANYDRIEALLVPAVRDDPNDFESRNLLARMYTSRYQSTPASQRTAATMGAAVVEVAKGVAMWDDLVRADPQSAQYRNGLGSALSSLAYVNQLSLRWNDAVQASLRAVDQLSLLTREHPRVQSYRHSLTGAHSALAESYKGLNKWPEAEASYRTAIALEEQLAREYPGVSDYPRDCAIDCYHLAAMLTKIGRLADAVPFADRGVELLEIATRDQPDMPGTRGSLSKAYAARAKLRRSMHDYAAAREDYDRAIATAGPIPIPYYRRDRAVVLARLGDHAAAFAEAEQQSASQQPDASIDICRARIAAVCCEAARGDIRLTTAEREALADRYAARAIHWVVEARAHGYFNDTSARARVEADPDLAALQGRADFRQLLQ